ncbi:hypothetical protein [Amycolatopsis sp. cmx-4-68]|uniref:hypothetical protein n=1 Tax=Amycolatopsis sp. cmx-4-68 TaxID=2790938 RepID=UPI00397A760F
MVFDLKQVSRYLRDPRLREAARAAIGKLITEDTWVVVAYSLGSVVAYEALAAMPGHQVRALVTLGSPLGIANGSAQTSVDTEADYFSGRCCGRVDGQTRPG